VDPDNVRQIGFVHLFPLDQSCLSCASLLLSKQYVQSLQVPMKRSASRRTSQGEIASDDSSSGGHDQFVISPRPRRATRKASHGGEGSSSQADKEESRITEGRVVAATRDARASDVIQKVERPLKLDFEYTLRRVDRHHPRRPTDYTRGENQSIINWNEDLYEWTIELHDHRFWSNFQADWYISVIKDRKNPITS
jgi:hypothetical protein